MAAMQCTAHVCMSSLCDDIVRPEFTLTVSSLYLNGRKPRLMISGLSGRHLYPIILHDAHCQDRSLGRAAQNLNSVDCCIVSEQRA